MKFSDFKPDPKAVGAVVVGSIAVVIVAMVINKFLPDSVPGAATVKAVATQAAS